MLGLAAMTAVGRRARCGISITVMEIMDNATALAVPGAMVAGLTDTLFWAASSPR